MENEHEVSKSANVFTLHIVFTLELEQKQGLLRKAGLLPNGNRDTVEFNVKKDLATSQFYVIRLHLSVSTALRFKLGSAYIKGACLQNGRRKKKF